jgi:hypothetical protein
MATRNDLTLFLGLRFHEAGAGTLRILEALLEEVAELGSGLRVPLHWNTPLYPLFSGSSRALTDLITEIKARIASRGDVVAPPGFRGALHPLLDDQELTRELSWCRRNPWVPGFRGLLGQEPQVAIPMAPDLGREAADGVYSRAGFPIVGLPMRVAGAAPGPRDHRRRKHEAAKEPGRFLLWHEPDRASVIAAWVLGLEELAADSPAMSALGAAGSGPLLVLLDLCQGEEKDRSPGSFGGDRPVARLLDALSHRRTVVPASLCEEALKAANPVPARTPGRNQPLLDPPPAALLHASEACAPLEAETGLFALGRQRRAQALRRPGRRRNLDIRGALEIMAADVLDEERAVRAAKHQGGTEPLRTGQILFAEMGGVVSLPGPGYAAHFADGRLRGLSRGGEQILSGLPAECWFDFGGRRCLLQTVSAASFEREGDHGMATAFACPLDSGGGEVRMRAEAYFREGWPELRLELSVSFPPAAPPLRAASPYEIPLFRLAERQTAELETELEGGKRHVQRIPPREGFLLACGRSIRLRLGGTAVVVEEGADEEDATSTMALPLRVAREPGGWALRACLGGRTCSRAPLRVAGTRSSVGYRILVEAG